MTDRGLIRDGALYLSASTMERATCWRRLWYYKVMGKRPAAVSAGLAAGTAMHAGLAELARGRPVAVQEGAISASIARAGLPAEDYRTAAYLHDALAQFRAEAPLAGWTLEEVEEEGELELGSVLAGSPTCLLWGIESPVRVVWSFRRDAVGVAGDGRRYVVDFKTSQRDEQAAYAALRNSGQLISYLWSWNLQHPDKPAVGVQPVRIIMRAPTVRGGGVRYSFPQDREIYFDGARVEEWRRSVLAFAGELLRLDPDRPEQWRMAYTEAGLCRNQWGVCRYLETCCLPNDEQRRVYLDSPAYKDDERGL